VCVFASHVLVFLQPLPTQNPQNLQKNSQNLSDAFEFGGRGRVGHGVDHFTEPAPEGQPFHGRGQSMRVLAPSRTVVAYRRQKEPGEPGYEAPAAADEAPAAADEAGSSGSSGTVVEEQGLARSSQDWTTPVLERNDGTDGRDGTALA
jgi:hypothetical protein